MTGNLLRFWPFDTAVSDETLDSMEAEAKSMLSIVQALRPVAPERRSAILLAAAVLADGDPRPAGTEAADEQAQEAGRDG